MTDTKDRHFAHGTKGRVLHWAAAYDLLAWVLLRGKEPAFRERLVRLARLQPGESVLDVGCGTGSLAIAAKRAVGPLGTVHGIDPAAEMIARASKKARKAGVEVTFTTGVVEALPFPDGNFDAVLSTLMLHHVPAEARQRCAAEMRRVLKPRGRVLAVDFGKPAGAWGSLLELFHRDHHVDLREIVNLLSEAGFEVVESAAVGARGLNFVLATA